MTSLTRFGMVVVLFMNCCVIGMDVEQVFFKSFEKQCGQAKPKQEKMTLEDFLKHQTEEYKKHLKQKDSGISVIEKHLQQKGQHKDANTKAKL